MAEAEKIGAVEPWLRGTWTELDPVLRQVVHALELAGEDAERWCSELTAAQMELRPFGLASVGFHLRHAAGSLDRLLTYAEGRQLSEDQLANLRTELSGGGRDALAEFRIGLREAEVRVRSFEGKRFSEPREVGRGRLPSTVAGLLVHCAEHTQRHLGQAITTAQFAVRLS